MQLSCLIIMTGTTINSILTAISIFCAIGSIISANRARKIKEAVYQKLDTIDFIPFVEKFDVDYKKLSSKIISKNISGDIEEVKGIVNTANTMIISINKYLPLLDKGTQEIINGYKSDIQSEIKKMNNSQVPNLSLILSLLDSIDVALHKKADEMKKD